MGITLVVWAVVVYFGAILGVQGLDERTDLTESQYRTLQTSYQIRFLILTGIVAGVSYWIRRKKRK